MAPSNKGQQCSLDSFFDAAGIASASKKGNTHIQKRMKSSLGSSTGKIQTYEDKDCKKRKQVTDPPIATNQAVKIKLLEGDGKSKEKVTKRRVINDSSDEDNAESIADTLEVSGNTMIQKASVPNCNDDRGLTQCFTIVNEASSKQLSMDEDTEIDEDSIESGQANEPKLLDVRSDAFLKDIDDSKWGKDVPYSVLCEAFKNIEAVSGRLVIQEIMTTLFRQVMSKSFHDMVAVLYLASNSVAPAYECLELGVGDSLLYSAIGQACGINATKVKEKYQKAGDLGTVAQSCKSKQKTLGGFFACTSHTSSKASLTASDVLNNFRQIAEIKGSNSRKFKIDLIKKMLVQAADPMETKYIIRGLQGKLRIGLAQSTVLISLAHALALNQDATENNASLSGNIDGYPEEVQHFLNKSLPIGKHLEAAVAIVRKAFSEVPSYEAILSAARKVPLAELHKVCVLTPGIPVSPMLAKPTKSVQEVLKRLTGLNFTCEYKYDGERAQVHMLSNGTTKVFSRNLLDTSEKYPEVPIFVREASKDVVSFVLDSEVVAFNRDSGKLVPFQILSTRKKSEESAETAKVQVIIQAFDLMYLNGESLLCCTLAQRRALLHKHFTPIAGKFQFATYIDHQDDGDTMVLEDFLENAVKGQCEGLMIKTLDLNAIYEPSRRSLNWLKLKKDYLEGLGDSFDLVPLGAYYGRGKRTGLYGAYLLACFDPDTDTYQSVCKIGTGFSDEDLKMLAKDLDKHRILLKSSQYNVSDQLECDVWFDAVQVWEIKAADLSKSSAHRGAEGKTGVADRGIGLRFPRFERLRTDKNPEEATTSHQILDMYYQQDSIIDGDEDNEGI